MAEKLSSAFMDWMQAQELVRQFYQNNPGQPLPVVLHANLQRAEKAYQASVQQSRREAQRENR